MARKVADACALPGPLRARSRDRLPDEAFGLPKERKYPMYRLARGKLVPDGSHAANAKARARQQYEKGSLTMAQLVSIEAKANKVLRLCKARGGKRQANDNPHGKSQRSKLRGAIRRDR